MSRGSDISEEGEQNGPLSTEMDPDLWFSFQPLLRVQLKVRMGEGAGSAVRGVRVHLTVCGLWRISNPVAN